MELSNIARRYRHALKCHYDRQKQLKAGLMTGLLWPPAFRISSADACDSLIGFRYIYGCVCQRRRSDSEW